jgi:hypothetical protein
MKNSITKNIPFLQINKPQKQQLNKTSKQRKYKETGPYDNKKSERKVSVVQ